MITVGTPLAGKYKDGDKKVTDYTGIVTAVDSPTDEHPEFILTTITFHGGRTEHYITDTNGHSVDTGMTPVPCPLASDPAPLIPVH